MGRFRALRRRRYTHACEYNCARGKKASGRALDLDAAAWRLNMHRREMNFPEVMTLQWTQNLAPRSRVVTEEDRRRNRRQKRRLSIPEMDEHAMVKWHPQFLPQVLDKRKFFAQKRAERTEKRAKQAAYREDRHTRKQAVLF
ncbi:T-complex protein 1 subunit eta [Hordeum vulgare]|nr:T-complex protein 1 subunit eta [Hordeum vulgare]